MKSFRFLLFTIILFLFCGLNNAQNSSGLQQKVEQTASSKALYHGQWGVYARYVESGKEIISLNEEMSLAPASGLKVFTTSAALQLLGEDYTFKTNLYYEGKITNGILDGNIFIQGGGDPTLGSNKTKGSLPLDSLMMSWADAIKKAGISKINGAVIADAFFFDDQTVPDYWPWIDIGNYYGAGPNSLTINDNLYYLFFKPSSIVGGPAEVLRTEPVIENLTFKNYMKTGPEGSGDNGYIYAGPGDYSAVLRGTIPAGVDEFSIKGSMPDPPLFAAQYFTSYLKKNGIDVSLPAAKSDSKKFFSQASLIHTTVSPPLKDIVYTINKISFNLYTEHLLKTIAVEKTGTVSTENGIKTIKSFLDSAEISTEGFDLYDGSGLSRTNMITAKMMADLLAFMSRQKTFDSFFNSLVVFNLKDGKKAWVKTGLINGVRSHSGYVKDENGKLITFSFIANNFPGRIAEINEIHTNLISMLSALK